MPPIQPIELTEDSLKFTFAVGVEATKYDDWSHYRNQFNSAFGGTKAVDLIAIDNGTTWLIEVKDYRAHRRTKPIDLGEEVALKVRDTLAGLVSAKLHANDAAEKRFAKEALKQPRLKIALHLEQQRKPSKLFPLAVDPSKVKMKLKQWLKALDAHPAIVTQQTLKPEMNWTVQG
ncbi:hypothetical protein GCM10011369_05790 [Neiella marina]|uniref:Cysteinyl-tRNA synthetase n=1 Tax=Neiella marina TaxID=508461 RepID=A0A8J2XL76_9GAMM|nr:hypothetical protein [Neiella marina]GGA66996.1 hypothetical protein GCM10011369_05790 [Neiella marina]